MSLCGLKSRTLAPWVCRHLGESFDDNELLLALCAAEQLTIKCPCQPCLLCKTWPRIFTWLELEGCWDFLKKWDTWESQAPVNTRKVHGVKWFWITACDTDEEGLGNPLQYSCLENPMDKGLQLMRSQRVRHAWSNLAQHTWYWNKSKAKRKIKRWKEDTLNASMLKLSTSDDFSSCFQNCLDSKSPTGEASSCGLSKMGTCVSTSSPISWLMCPEHVVTCVHPLQVAVLLWPPLCSAVWSTVAPYLHFKPRLSQTSQPKQA